MTRAGGGSPAPSWRSLHPSHRPSGANPETSPRWSNGPSSTPATGHLHEKQRRALFTQGVGHCAHAPLCRVLSNESSQKLVGGDKPKPGAVRVPLLRHPARPRLQLDVIGRRRHCPTKETIVFQCCARRGAEGPNLRQGAEHGVRHQSPHVHSRFGPALQEAHDIARHCQVLRQGADPLVPGLQQSAEAAEQPFGR